LFAGASRELIDAVIVNPYAIDDSAHALAQALNMPRAEQVTRMRAMRAVVAEFNAYRWVGEMLMDTALARVDREHHQHQWQTDALQVS
jgi:trehalose 6-phosphate synthase